MGTMSVMNSDQSAEVTALAINVTIPEALRWTDTRRGETFTLTTLNVRLLADGHSPSGPTADRPAVAAAPMSPLPYRRTHAGCSHRRGCHTS